MIIVLMGVSGCGKTTIGKLLAQKLNCPFYDGDDYHPQANKDKMAAGQPLTDEDRLPWLLLLNDLLIKNQKAAVDAVLACSALKQSYRNILSRHVADMRFIYLKGDYDLIAGRVRQRAGHYMKANMLKSQFDVLEEPDNATVINIIDRPEPLVKKIVQLLKREV